MKVLHLSTSSLGGAGVVASRIAELQVEQGQEVTFITLNGSGYSKSTLKKRTWQKKAIANLNTAISLFDTRSDWRQLTPISMRSGILADVQKIRPDVIHIHNWFNLLSVSELQKTMKLFPCVFHLHDERMLTGGCHFTLGCERYKAGCNKCPATSLKRRMISNSKSHLTDLFSLGIPYGLLFPSNWLKDKFVNAPIYTGAAKVIVATNPIDEETITSFIPEKSPIITCVISDLNAKVKGFDVFLNAVKLLRASSNQIEIQVVGGNATKSQIKLSEELNVELLGRMSNVEALKVIGSSNLLVVPSHSENSPTVILEAQSLGTCVLATDIPGCRELIENQVTGYLCQPSPESIFAGIQEVVSNNFNSRITDAAKAKSSLRSRDYLPNLTNMYWDLIHFHGRK